MSFSMMKNNIASSMKNAFIVGLLAASVSVSNGQELTYIGVDIGPKFELYQYLDNGDGLYTKPFYHSPIYGVSIGQDLNETLSVEIWILHQQLRREL